MKCRIKIICAHEMQSFRHLSFIAFLVVDKNYLNFFKWKNHYMIPVTMPFIEGTEAAEVGMAKEVVPHTNLMTRAQVITVPYFVSNVRRPFNKYGTPV